jgi:hypothetical protein
MDRKIRGRRMIKITLSACWDTPSPVRRERNTRKTMAGDMLRRPINREDISAGIRRIARLKITTRSLFVYCAIILKQDTIRPNNIQLFFQKNKQNIIKQMIMIFAPPVAQNPQA